ncbi:MAG TPA: type II toxin-antitoxin system PemK/MazF family toxin [Lacipirellulaceae bacterium]|jgi:mRNA interferase MazF|nr:type II toxin-antitoxin system PemK/MazF family toxin [Lacipirellulaceae bacterium]
MKEGDILLTALRQADGSTKNRPVLLLRRLPPFQDLLVCGLSTQLHQAAAELDKVIAPSDDDFRQSGLKAASLIRVSFLAVLPRREFKGRIGSISAARRDRLLTKLADFLRPK